ncbi:class I SAM-dependent methyltransferase [Thalassospira marina]|uniref:Methyltransferase n=1 Tax=Thalassospira marina TaxID=2048283 RepID=A0A2N3KY92_9PROT|nr:class I SAM-dependent methyltransferase [Thalassospira marina]PKR55531.1 hypothetical protein COO20_05030 [Thalassospira marina]
MIRSWCFKDTEDDNFYYDLTDLNVEHFIYSIAAVTKTDHRVVQSYIDEIRNDSWVRDFITVGLGSSHYQKDIKFEFSRRMGWYAFARILKPKLIVETGVHHGIGACVLTRALMKNKEEGYEGKYFGTDIDRNAGKLLRVPLSDFGKVLYGDSLQSLKEINEEIDLFINDSDHSADYEMKEYEEVRGKLSSDAVILGDNSHVTDKLSKFSGETGRDFIFVAEKPKNHWYPGAGIGVSFPRR